MNIHKSTGNSTLRRTTRIQTCYSYKRTHYLSGELNISNFSLNTSQKWRKPVAQHFRLKRTLAQHCPVMKTAPGLGQESRSLFIPGNAAAPVCKYGQPFLGCILITLTTATILVLKLATEAIFTTLGHGQVQVRFNLSVCLPLTANFVTPAAVDDNIW